VSCYISIISACTLYLYMKCIDASHHRSLTCNKVYPRHFKFNYGRKICCSVLVPNNWIKWKTDFSRFVFISLCFSPQSCIFYDILMHHRFMLIHIFHLDAIHLFISFEKLSVEHLCQFYGYFIVIKTKQDYNFLMCCYFCRNLLAIC
jgi:hypothetical protein